MTRCVLLVEETAPCVFDALKAVLDGSAWQLVDPTTLPANGATRAREMGPCGKDPVGLIVWWGDFFRSSATLLKSGVERFVLLAPGGWENRPWKGHPRVPPWHQHAFQAAFTVCSEASKPALLAALSSVKACEEDTLRRLMRTTARVLPEENPDRFLIQTMSWYVNERDALQQDVDRAFEVLKKAIRLSLKGDEAFDWRTRLRSIGLAEYADVGRKNLLVSLADVRGQRAVGSAQALAGSEHLLTRDLEEAIQKWDGSPSDTSVAKAAIQLRLVELLRDIGTSLAAGAGPWARRELKSDPLKVLLIDDQPRRINRLLQCAFDTFGSPGAELYEASES